MIRLSPCITFREPSSGFLSWRCGGIGSTTTTTMVEKERRKAKYCYMCGATNEEAYDKQQGRRTHTERRRQRERVCHGAIGEMECENDGEKE